MMFVKDVAKILKTFRMKSRNKLEKYFSFYNYYDSIFERIAAHHDSHVKKLQKEINYSQKHE